MTLPKTACACRRELGHAAVSLGNRFLANSVSDVYGSSTHVSLQLDTAHGQLPLSWLVLLLIAVWPSTLQEREQKRWFGLDSQQFKTLCSRRSLPGLQIWPGASTRPRPDSCIFKRDAGMGDGAETA